MNAHPPQRRTGIEWNHAIRSLKRGMFGCAFVFAFIALIAAVLGFADIPHATVAVAKIAFFICVVMFALMLTFGIIIRNDSNRR